MINYDDAYANAAYIPNAEGFVETWAQGAEAFRARALAQGRAELDIPYGSSARQKSWELMKTQHLLKSAQHIGNSWVKCTLTKTEQIT